jgi:hypothetical protein
MLEVSMDHINWTELHRNSYPNQEVRLQMASFAVANSNECRIIRLTQAGPNLDGPGESAEFILVILSIEFFGMLHECR